MIFSFWDFIHKYKIEIPIIQRDYAQGRNGKKALRKLFIKDLKNALSNKQKLTLDFIYGSVKDGRLQPLDGQQRLTTLWLLHWFIALKSGNLDYSKNRLSNFSYETRVSTREFCCKILEFKLLEDLSKDKDLRLSEMIIKQKWFFYRWEQDPSIKAMLNMLDTIGEIFKNEEEFELYWEQLTGAGCPISFYALPIKNFGLSDDLYIKMNARGRALTPFENFKADFIRATKVFEQGQELTDSIAYKLDTLWTDLFWKHRGTENTKIDEVFFAFFKRYVLNQLILEYEKLDENSEVYQYLTNNSFKYNSGDFHHFDGIMTENHIDKLKKCFDNIATCYNGPKGNELFSYSWQEDFHFIPIIKSEESKKTISTINQVQRVAFYAFCKYFEQGEYDEVSFKQWKRFVWNLVSGKTLDGGDAIRSIREMKKAIEFFEKVPDSHKVYEELSKLKYQVDDKESALPFRFEEEIEKAKFIQNGDIKEDRLVEAESYAFFRGNIRFLIKNENGVYDYSSFEEKFRNAKQLFKEKDFEKDALRAEDAGLLKILISNIADSILWNREVFDNRTETWLFYLNSLEIADSISKLLLNKLYYKSINEENAIIWYLSQTKLLDYSREFLPNSRIRWTHHHRTFYPARREGVFLPLEEEIRVRNLILLSLKKQGYISFRYNNTVVDEENNLLFGWNIYFRYKDRFFVWWEDSKVYAMKEEWKGYLQTEEDYIAFSVRDGERFLSKEEFLEKLKEFR